MVVLRHLVGTPFRKALLGHLDKVFNERVLLGVGVGSQETLRLVDLRSSLSCILLRFFVGRKDTPQ
jgi:hypothetical protein